MRLERLTLSPYGRFADRTLEFKPEAALHVVLGLNESGKTTALTALGDLIYGFPGQTPYGFRHDQRLLRVGGIFHLADGSRLEFRRRKGNLNTLVDADDKPIADAALRSRLSAAMWLLDARSIKNCRGARHGPSVSAARALLRIKKTA